MTKRTKSWVALLLFIAVFGALLVTATFTDLQVSNILTAKALAAHTYYTNETVYGVVLEAVGSSPVYLMLAFSFQILFWQVMRKMKKTKIRGKAVRVSRDVPKETGPKKKARSADHLKKKKFRKKAEK